ncbi:hypothetical protein EDC96DRAFT_567380 [Choanephora cucurbitarum]|nr:hypothetical protein EDC96DRAFT_567380 [Choanephora cucurbitarum]
MSVFILKLPELNLAKNKSEIILQIYRRFDPSIRREGLKNQVTLISEEGRCFGCLGLGVPKFKEYDLHFLKFLSCVVLFSSHSTIGVGAGIRYRYQIRKTEMEVNSPIVLEYKTLRELTVIVKISVNPFPIAKWLRIVLSILFLEEQRGCAFSVQQTTNAGLFRNRDANTTANIRSTLLEYVLESMPAAFMRGQQDQIP